MESHTHMEAFMPAATRPGAITNPVTQTAPAVPALRASTEPALHPGQPLTLPPQVLVEKRDTLASDTFARWLTDRQRYVESQGWHYGADLDSYDLNPETRHVIALNADRAIVGGLRLTPIAHARHALTWGMLTPAMRAVGLDAPELKSTRGLWDLTRLIPSQRARLHSRTQMDVLCEIFGAAAADSLLSAALVPRWIFATTGTFYRLARRSGIFFNEIARSSHDRLSDQVVFCSIRPDQGVNELLRRRHENDRFNRSAEFLLRGLAGRASD
ncbi:hypothetical protein JT358_10295 [Micrococcales bacterium 31B]|nr:hypothetical protein [Micrococcales bacterium 31B]